MRRSDVCEPTGAFPGDRPWDPHPVVINRREDQFGSRRHERAAGARVVRLLHEHAVAGVQQHATDQVQSLLRSVHDHDPVRLCIEPAQATESSGDGLPQLPASCGWTVLEVGQAGMARTRAEQPAPEGIRQIGERGAAGTEVVTHVRRRQLPGQAGQSQALAARSSGPQESLSSSGDDRAAPGGRRPGSAGAAAPAATQAIRVAERAQRPSRPRPRVPRDSPPPAIARRPSPRCCARHSRARRSRGWMEPARPRPAGRRVSRRAAPGRPDDRAVRFRRAAARWTYLVTRTYRRQRSMGNREWTHEIVSKWTLSSPRIGAQHDGHDSDEASSRHARMLGGWPRFSA